MRAKAIRPGVSFRPLQNQERRFGFCTAPQTTYMPMEYQRPIAVYRCRGLQSDALGIHLHRGRCGVIKCSMC